MIVEVVLLTPPQVLVLALSSPLQVMAHLYLPALVGYLIGCSQLDLFPISQVLALLVIVTIILFLFLLFRLEGSVVSIVAQDLQADFEH